MSEAVHLAKRVVVLLFAGRNESEEKDRRNQPQADDEDVGIDFV